MALGKKTGGRVKGTPNKATQEIQAKLEALGCDPLEGMAKIALQSMDAGDLKLAGQMFAELAQYVAPKRKAIEHSGEVLTAPTLNIILTGDGTP